MSNGQKKILIIDDEPDMLNYLGTCLKDNGFEVIQAVNGKEGFDKAKETQPDLITLDIAMPEETGSKALRNFQEAEETKDIPIIIITGLAKDFKKFISTRKVVSPPADYMEKPIDLEEFLEKINEILG